MDRESTTIRHNHIRKAIIIILHNPTKITNLKGISYLLKLPLFRRIILVCIWMIPLGKLQNFMDTNIIDNKHKKRSDR